MFACARSTKRSTTSMPGPADTVTGCSRRTVWLTASASWCAATEVVRGQSASGTRWLVALRHRARKADHDHQMLLGCEEIDHDSRMPGQEFKIRNHDRGKAD